VDLLADGISGEAVGVHGEELIHIPVEEAMNSVVPVDTIKEMHDLTIRLAGVQ